MYVLHVVSGSELSILSELKRLNLQGCVPMRTVLERHGGKWIKVGRRLFPSYVFLDCDYTAENYFKTKSVAGVIGWLGSPTALPLHEEEYIEWLRNNDRPIEPSDIQIENGKIKAVSGVLVGHENDIKRIMKRQRRVVAEITIAGRTYDITLAVNII